jgi:hypothetical protein
MLSVTSQKFDQNTDKFHRDFNGFPQYPQANARDYSFLLANLQIIIRQSFYRGQDWVLDKEMWTEELQKFRENLNVSLAIELPHYLKINS